MITTTLEVEEYRNNVSALVNYQTGEEITWEVPWAPDEALGDSWIQTLRSSPVLSLDFVMPYESRVYPMTVDAEYPCPVCDFPYSTYFYLRGLCENQDPDATFDTYYKLVSDKYGNISMHGEQSTSIIHDATTKQWKMTRKSSVRGTLG